MTMAVKTNFKKTIFWVGTATVFIVAVVFVIPIAYQLITHLDYDVKARRYKVKNDLEDIVEQIDKYQKLKGSLPKKLTELVAPPEIKIHEPWHFKKLPKDPWGVPYNYNVERKNGSETYTVGTLGKDKKLGGEGENSDLSNSTNWKVILDTN